MIQGHVPHWQWIPYEDISPTLAHAVIASEDNLFCEESLGFDIDALRGQIDAWHDGKRPRGASTITCKRRRTCCCGRAGSGRKLIEAWLTPQIALLWPKRRVLEVYLNIVEFGPGIYGAGAAARAVLSQAAAELTAREAAQLAAVSCRGPLVAGVAAEPVCRERVPVIERRMEQIRPLLDARSDGWTGGRESRDTSSVARVTLQPWSRTASPFPRV